MEMIFYSIYLHKWDGQSWNLNFKLNKNIKFDIENNVHENLNRLKTNIFHHNVKLQQ